MWAIRWINHWFTHIFGFGSVLRATNLSDGHKSVLTRRASCGNNKFIMEYQIDCWYNLFFVWFCWLFLVFILFFSLITKNIKLILQKYLNRKWTAWGSAQDRCTVLWIIQTNWRMQLKQRTQSSIIIFFCLAFYSNVWVVEHSHSQLTMSSNSNCHYSQLKCFIFSFFFLCLLTVRKWTNGKRISAQKI